MKRYVVFTILALTLLVQSACGAPAATAVEATAPPAAVVPQTTATSTSAPPPPPTATATLALPVTAGTALPAPNAALSKDNIGDITQVARWGTGQVRDVAYSPDGKLIGIATPLGVAVLDAGSLAPQVNVETKSPVNAFAFSPDGASLVTGMLDNTVMTWNTADGTLISSFTGKTKEIKDPKLPKESVQAVAFSDDGGMIAAGSSEGYVNVWKTADGSVVQSLTDHVLGVTSVFFSKDGTAVFSASRDGSVRMTGLSDGKLVRAFGANYVKDAALSPDGTLLAVDSLGYYLAAGNIKIWDVQSGKQLQQINGGDYKTAIYSIAFSPDGKSLAGARQNYDVTVWNVEDGSQIGTTPELRPTAPLPEGWWWIVSPYVAFSPDGKSLAWGGSNSLAFLDPTGASIVKKEVVATPYISGIALSPDGKLLASSEWGYVRIRNFADGSLVTGLPEMSVQGNVAFSPDSQRVGYNGLDAAHEHSAAILSPVSGGDLPQNLDTGQAFGWGLVAFLPDGKTLAVGVAREIMLFNVSDGTLVRTIHSGLSQDFTDMDFSADGKLVAVSAGNDSKVLSVEDGTRLQVHSNNGNAVAFSPDSTLLAGSDYKKNVTIWKAATNDVVLTIGDNADNVSALRFSPDGSLLIGGLADGSLVAWSMPDGAVVKTWAGHSQGVTGLLFTPDGNRIVTSSADGTIRVWGLKP